MSLAKTICTLLSVTMLAGCTSFKSTIVHRKQDDSLRPQFCQRTSKGIPVTLKVPSHLDVTVYETYQLVLGKKQDSGVTPPEVVTLTEPGQPRLLNIETELQYTPKVFTVDFPRPFAGTLTLGGNADGITLDSEQYFAKIRGEIEDKTIEEVGAIFSTQLPKLAETFSKAGSLTGAGGVGDTPNIEGVNLDRRVVAFQRFDISEPGWENCVQDFVTQHLNACNPPCGVNCPPGPIYSSEAVHEGQGRGLNFPDQLHDVEVGYVSP